MELCKEYPFICMLPGAFSGTGSGLADNRPTHPLPEKASCCK